MLEKYFIEEPRAIDIEKFYISSKLKMDNEYISIDDAINAIEEVYNENILSIYNINKIDSAIISIIKEVSHIIYNRLLDSNYTYFKQDYYENTILYFNDFDINIILNKLYKFSDNNNNFFYIIEFLRSFIINKFIDKNKSDDEIYKVYYINLADLFLKIDRLDIFNIYNRI